MRISICLPTQALDLRDAEGRCVQRFSVSTAKNGAGEKNGSYRTPRGPHIVRAKVGAGMTADTVFVRRRPTGELWTPELAAQFPDRDWILTRILWLSGKRVGFNRLGDVDTMRRYVYIHGSPDTVEMGTPGSIGCIRMRNCDIIELFDAVPVLTRVDIDDFYVTGGDWAMQEPAAMPVRESVFVNEQKVPPEMERDEFDALSYHVVAYGSNQQVIGTGRLLPDGHIGRLAVVSDWRGRGVGRALMDALMDEADARGYDQLQLNAQTQALGFYRQFAFVEVGMNFMEAGIPHRTMVTQRRGV